MDDATFQSLEVNRNIDMGFVFLREILGTLRFLIASQTVLPSFMSRTMALAWPSTISRLRWRLRAVGLMSTSGT